jgi:predicted glycogen debranching enzyme
MFNHITEYLVLPDCRRIRISGEDPNLPEDEQDNFKPFITEFRLENQIPFWRYEVEDYVIEKHVLLLHGQNTVHVTYQLVSGPGDVELHMRPSLHFRPHEHTVGEPLDDHYTLTLKGRLYEVLAGDPYPPLRFTAHGDAATFTHEGGQIREIGYQSESERGYHSIGSLWSPGYFGVKLQPRRTATLIASTEAWPTIMALSPEEARTSDAERRRRLLAVAHPKAQEGPAAELVMAADQFIITPAGRVEDAARARASGDEVRSVIAGYHWFTDWGRDTMISLEGLTITTGRHLEAGWILRTFGHYIRNGLIPNYFPDGQTDGLYHTADATLWFFHALDRYVEATNDRSTLILLLPKLREVIECHLRGTHYGIVVDHHDGLLRQGAEGYQLTWMDAKVDDWVVTPRRGKAVEINALWYNALRLMEGWLLEEHGEEDAATIRAHADRARDSFNKRFWCERLNHLLDVVDGENGDDDACRPNQVFAISLKHPVLAETYWGPVLDTVKARLLTPVGLRSLAANHPDYKARYFGDLRARDAAYHQGTVWGWLIGPFIDAWLKLHPDDKAGARKWLEGFLPHLNHGCIGSVSEVFDAEPPFTARGCIAQAWSVAEALRCWVKTSE